MATSAEILDNIVRRAIANSEQPVIKDAAILERVGFVCRNSNRSAVRALLACLLAKIHNPDVDIRKPYTELEGNDTYSGRRYDEKFITAFINTHHLPCNLTTAFLTPAFRDRVVLTPDVILNGRPPQLYKTLLLLFNDVHTGAASAEDLLTEIVKCLLVIRDEKLQWMETVKDRIKASEGAAPLSAEAIVTLIDQHLHCPKASRLPVLVVAAAYHAAQTRLGERIKPLQAHNAADEQTGSLGDLEVTLINDEKVITS